LARTGTNSETHTRLRLMSLNIDRLLRRTTGADDDVVNRILLGIRKQYVKSVQVYGMNSSGEAMVGIRLSIDWSIHSISVKEITVDSRQWREGIAPEVQGLIRTFNEWVAEENLSTEWRVMFAQDLSSDPGRLGEVMQELGMTKAQKLSWAGPVQEEDAAIEELPELRPTLRYVG